MKIVKFPEDAVFLIYAVTETVENEVKDQKRGFLVMLPATLGASLLGNMLAGKGAVRVDDGVIRADEGKVELVRIFLCCLIL